MEKRGLFAYAYTKESSPVTDSIKLVEWRVERGVSDEPEEDLTRLIEHYQNTFQWHKANAASRQILALANGESAKFQVLPEDHEVQEARLRLFRYKLNHQAFPWSIAVLALILVVLTAQRQSENWHHHRYTQSELISGSARPANFLDTVNAGLFPGDLGVRLAGVRQSYSRKRFAEAMEKINGILRQYPNSSEAYELKAMILRDCNELSSALLAVENVDHYRGYYFLKEGILFRLGRLNEAADVAEAFANSVDGGTADAYFEACFKRRFASQFPRSLDLARKGTSLAKSEAERARGLAIQAYLLPDLDASILASSEAIRIAQEQSEAKKGSLSGYERFCLEEAFEAFLHRGNAYHQKGDNIEALKDITLYLAEHRWQSDVFRLRADIYEELGQKDKAAMDRKYAELVSMKEIEYSLKLKLGKDNIFGPL